MADPWAEFRVAPTGQDGAPDAWGEFRAAPTAVQAKRAAPFEAQGAPYKIRLAVGTARPQDRLATIRSYFPDAEETDDGNFVYTDPATKKRTLYNPKGIDLGDIPSVTREAAEMAGAGAGAVAGIPGGLAGAAGGAGLGGAVAGKAVDLARSAAGLPQGYSARDTATDIGVNAAGEIGGRALAELGHAGARALIRPGAQETVQAAARAGVPLTASQVARGPLAAVEHSQAAVVPMSRPQRTQAQLYDQAEAMLEAARPPTPGNPQDVRTAAAHAGGALKEAADARYAKFKVVRQKLDDDFYSALPRGLKLTLPKVRQAAQAMQQMAADSPGVAGGELAPALQMVDRIMQDLQANQGRLPINLVRRARTVLGQELDTEASTALTPAAQTAMRNVYNALRDDLYGAAQQVSPTAARKLARHDRLVRSFRGEDMGRESAAGSLDSILKANSDEAAWNALNASTGGQKRMARLVQAMDEPQRRVVARAAWQRMTTTGPGNPADPGTWATKWLSTPAESRWLLFGGVMDLEQTDALARTLRAQAEGARYKNFSGTGYELQRAGLLGSLGKAAISLAGTGSLGVADEALLAGGGTAILSELVFHPAALRALVRAASAPAGAATGPVARTLGGAGAQLGRQAMPPPQSATPPPMPLPPRRNLLGGP